MDHQVEYHRAGKYFDEQVCNLKSTDGHTIYVKHMIPTAGLSKVKYHIFFVHGAIEHLGRHDAIFDYLKNHFRSEIVISTYDHVGHGKSTGPRASIDNFKIYSDDFLNFINKSDFLENKKDLKRILITHSMGGLVVLNSIFQNRCKFNQYFSGIVFSNPCIKPTMNLPKFSIDMIESLPENILKLRLPLVHHGQGLCNDAQKSAEFDTDPLISKFIGLKLGLEISAAAKNVRTYSYYLDRPCLFLLSDEDYICDAQMTKLFASGIDKHLVTIKEYKNCKHELFNEIIRNKVFEDLTTWIKLRTVHV
jgi:alpha-beta hydrolase superfamily lysophospholipase